MVMAKKKVLVFEKVVPDTSVVVEGVLSKMVDKNELNVKQVIIHEAVLAELESQANKNRETGHLGLEEVEKLRSLASKKKFKVVFKGSRPGDFEIRYAKSGEIDSLIRHLAFEENATLFTADIVQSKVALAKGINTYLYEFPEEEIRISIEEYFDKDTMSVHIREGCKAMAKKGKPGSWKYKEVSKKVFSSEEVKALSKDVIENAKKSKDSFIEMDRRGSTVVQFGRHRIVLVRPPFSDGFEITAVRPVRHLKFKDYELDETLRERLLDGAEGVLVAGPPGHGKSTFVQALAEEYLGKGLSVRTVESPRDMVVPPQVSRYSLGHGSVSEVKDILLLSRPDFTVFDEVRNREDFELFSDLRLAGIGLLGVIHAAVPIDAIQRFVGRLELRVIPSVIDTVVFVKDGSVQKVFSLAIDVKVPSGMVESDLARPVVTIYDFSTGKLEFEVYSYGEQTVVVPVTKLGLKKPLHVLAAKEVKSALEEHDKDAVVEFLSDSSCIVYVSKDSFKDVIGRSGENIQFLEKKLGLSIKVKERSSASKDVKGKEMVKFSLEKSSKAITFKLRSGFEDRLVDVFIGEDFFLSAKSSKKGEIKLNLNSKVGKVLLDAVEKGDNIMLYS